MKKMLATSVALATLLASLASPALAAPSKHRPRVAPDMTAPFGRSASAPASMRQPDVVMLNGRVLGEDPDLNIRTQLLHDPVPDEY